MADFTPVVVVKDGQPDRIARTPAELVSYKFDGYAVKREAAKRDVESGAPAPQSAKPKPDPDK